MKISVDLSADESELLSSTASRLGVRPEEPNKCSDTWVTLVFSLFEVLLPRA